MGLSPILPLSFSHLYFLFIYHYSLMCYAAGVLNIFVVIPQILVSLLIPIVIDLFHHSIVAALIVGGIASLVGTVFFPRFFPLLFSSLFFPY